MSYFTAELNADSFKNEQDGRNNQGCFISFLFHFMAFKWRGHDAFVPTCNIDEFWPQLSYWEVVQSWIVLFRYYIHVTVTSKWSLLWSRKSSKDSVVWSDIGRCIKDFDLTMAWLLAERHIIVYFDRPGECSPEKDCCRYWWLTFRQPERKSLLESSGRETVRQLRGDHGTG